MNKPKIMVVGCFHMAGHSDLHGTNAGDIFSDERQKEINETLINLKTYGATKIAVEVKKTNNENMNKEYKEYTNGKLNLKNNEVHQIGFRLAKELNHDKIHAIDWMEQGAATHGAGEVFEYAKNNHPNIHQFIESCADFLENYPSQSINDMFRYMNSAACINKATEMYINHARIGVADDYYGMGWLIWWYQRNLIIFANLAELAEPDDKIMLLIGASHTGILNGFLADSALFELVHAADYL